MAFWNRRKNWDDEYDEYYAQDRRSGQPRERRKLRYLAHLLMLGFVGGIFIAIAGAINGPTMVEKLLSSLASPLGITWLGLIVLVYFSFLDRKPWPALMAFGCLLLLTAAGNQFVANGLARSLESPYQSINPYADDGPPFELIVVLGGGTNTNLSGQNQLTNDGDRVATAARMYHAGRVKKIVCTGSQNNIRDPKDLHPREEAANILMGLNVPRESIRQMKGMNTYEEMENLQTWLQEQNIKGRVGILTSAWHLPRAMRLAKSNGLKVEPVPANFLSEPFSPSSALVVPSSINLFITARMCKEYLAGLVGR